MPDATPRRKPAADETQYRYSRNDRACSVAIAVPPDQSLTKIHQRSDPCRTLDRPSANSIPPRRTSVCSHTVAGRSYHPFMATSPIDESAPFAPTPQRRRVCTIRTAMSARDRGPHKQCHRRSDAHGHLFPRESHTREQETPSPTDLRPVPFLDQWIDGDFQPTHDCSLPS